MTEDAPPHREDPRRLIGWTIGVVVVVLLVLYAAFLASHALLLVYVSVLFATGFSPLVRLIERQRVVPIGGRLPRWLAILIVYLAGLAVLVGVGIAIVPPLVEQAQELWRRGPVLIEQVQDWLIAQGILAQRLTLREAVEQAPGKPTDAASTVMYALWGLVGGVFGFVTILILTFYLLVESQRIFEGLVGLFPRHRRRDVASIGRTITEKVAAWLNGQLILGLTIGGSAAIGLGVMGVPYFYVLALIAAVGEIIPIVGPLLAAIPAVLVGFSVSVKLGIGVAIFFFVQQQIENHLLVPKLMERQVGVSPVVVIIALLIGGSLLGIVGALLAVPTAAIIQVLLAEILDHDENGA